jgi:hypothetical protein
MIRKLFAGLALAAVAGMAHATDINFDDGAAGAAVGSFYPGVTFSANTTWEFDNTLAGASDPLGIAGGSSFVYEFGPDEAIIATFDNPTNHVQIRGIDVGAAGIEIDAYDASNTLIGSDSAFGTGIGVGSFFDVFVDIADISSIHIFQPGTLNGSNDWGDGVVVDNFQFGKSGGIPEPASWALMLGGFGLAGAAMRRRRAAAAA